VKNEPDYPYLRGPREFDAEVFQEVRLPAGLEIGDPDKDLEKWGVTISTGAEYGGFVYLNDKIRADPEKLKYIMGDGRSKFTSFTAYPSAAGGAIVGAKYMSLGKDAEAYNDTISIIVQDPTTKYILPPCPDGFVTLTKDDVVGLDTSVCGWQIHVNSLPPSESQFVDAAANLPISSLIATWSLIGAVLLWFGWQLYGWLWNVCNPEDVETRAAERYEVLVQKREAKMRGSISPDVGMGGGGLPTTGKQEGDGDVDGGGDGDVVAPMGSLRSWAKSNYARRQSEREAALVSALARPSRPPPKAPQPANVDLEG